MADLTCSVPDCTYKCTRLYKGMCSTHYQRQRKGEPINGRPRTAMAGKCDLCGNAFEARHASRRYCSDSCRVSAAWGYSAPLTCRECGDRMTPSRTSRPQGEAICMPCRRDGRGAHGEGAYGRGCRCQVCRDGKARAMRAYWERVKAEHGVSYRTVWRRKFKAEHGYQPHRSGSQWIAMGDRLAIYERDEWKCHLCGKPIDPDAHFNDNLAASLDHIIPRSLGGPDSPENLRTAHRSCNSRRGVMLLEEVA